MGQPSGLLIATPKQHGHPMRFSWVSRKETNGPKHLHKANSKVR